MPRGRGFRLRRPFFVPPTPVDLGATRTEAFTGSMTQRWDRMLASCRHARYALDLGLWHGRRRGRQCMQLVQLCSTPDYPGTPGTPGTPDIPNISAPDTPGTPATPGLPGSTTTASGADNWCEDAESVTRWAREWKQQLRLDIVQN